MRKRFGDVLAVVTLVVYILFPLLVLAEWLLR